MADELLNDVFMKVFKKGIPNLDKFTNFEYAKSYVFRACESAFVSRARKLSNANEIPSSDEPLFENAADAGTEDDVLSQVALGHFRNKLSGSSLQTFDAWMAALKQSRSLQDSYAEAAEIMGLPVTTVKKRCVGLRARLTALYSA